MGHGQLTNFAAILRRHCGADARAGSGKRSNAADQRPGDPELLNSLTVGDFDARSKVPRWGCGRHAGVIALPKNLAMNPNLNLSASPSRAMKRFRSRLMKVCACALYLIAPFPLGWMAGTRTLDEHGIVGLLVLPALAVALAAGFGLFVLAQKVHDIAMEWRDSKSS
jgi:hypothetical protein